LDIMYPIQKGHVTNWDHMERIWEHIYTNCLKIPSNDANTPVLLTEPALAPREHREQMCQIFFEKLKVPSLYVAMAPVLSLYTSGRTNGIVIESGNQISHSVPIFEGFSLYHAIVQLEYAGQQLSDNVQRLLADRGITYPAPHRGEIVRFVKEKLCTCVKSASDYRQAVKSKTTQTVKLPDGTEVTLGGERFTPTEGLFQPALIGLQNTKGLHSACLESIRKCDLDITSLLFGNVVLSGGTTMFNGLQERMADELKEGEKNETIKVFAPADRKRSTWIGGSILASLPTFQDFWVTKAEYEESGKVDERKHAIHRSCF